MKSIFLFLTLLFAVQQTVLPVHVFQATSGVCSSKQMISQAPNNHSPQAGYQKTSSPEKDLATTGQAFLQNLNIPDTNAGSLFSLDSKRITACEKTTRLRQAPFLIDHPPQITLR